MDFTKEFAPREVDIFRGVLKLAGDGRNLSDLKVQDIATAAGLGKGTLYEYFRSKDEILLGTLVYCARSEIERMEASVYGQPINKGLFDTALEYIRDVIENRAASYTMLANALMPRQEEMFRSGMLASEKKRLESLLSQELQRGIDSGFIRPDVTYDYFLYVVFNVFLSYAHGLLRMKLRREGGGILPEGMPPLPPEPPAGDPGFPGDDHLEQYTYRILAGALGNVSLLEEL